MKENEFIRVFGLDIARMAIGECMPECNLDTVELKRLVESHEYIESYGGLSESKRTLEMRHGVINLDGWDKLKQAIADVESCFAQK